MPGRVLDDLHRADGDQTGLAARSVVGTARLLVRAETAGDRPVKIAMIGQKGIPATYGGIERHVEELSARLAQREHQVTAYCRRHYTPEGKSHRGVALKILSSINTKHLDAISHTARAVADAVRRDFDVIHFHAIGPSALVFVPRLLCGKRCAVVMTIHALDWRRRKWGWFARWCLRRSAWTGVRFANRVIAVSQLITDYFNTHSKNVVHIPNGVDAARREPLQELKRFGLSEKKYVLWLGRFVPEKRVENIIAAFRKTPSDMKLLLAGEIDESNTYVQSLRSAAEDDERIIFSGGLYGSAKAEALSHAAMMVQASDLEGFPIVLLEAMRYGLPILASDIPEHLEVLDPGVTGFVFRTGDVESLRKNLSWAMANRQEMVDTGRRAEREARRYDWEPITEQTEAVYREAVASLPAYRKKTRIATAKKLKKKKND